MYSFGLSRETLAQVKDIERVICLTLDRAKALEKVYRTQIEEKDEISNDIVEFEEKLKMLVFNLCREIK